MKRPRDALTYAKKQDGSFTIVMGQDWNGQLRFDDYPADIRFAVMREQAYVSDDNTAKLKAAKHISPAAFAAVLDDLMCEAAERIAEREAENDAEQRREGEAGFEPRARLMNGATDWADMAALDDKEEAADDLLGRDDDRDR